MKYKKRTCIKSGCSDEPYLGGLCKSHHEEAESKKRLRDEALTTLHHGTIDGELASDPKLRNELERLRECWYRTCSVLQTQRGIPSMPLDEAKYATDWCISMAQEIIKAEREIASGRQVSLSLESTRRWVWERFENLDAGLCSNGTRRE